MEDLRQRGGVVKTLSVSRKMLGKHTFSAFSSLIRELKPVYKDNRFQRIVWLGLLNLSSFLVLLHWCNITESMGLLSYTYLIFFDTLCLCTCALSIWVEQKKPNTQYTYGYERFEVLAVFVSTTFAFISSFFIIKKSIAKWIQQTHVHTGRLFPGILLAFFCHMLVTYCMKNKGLNLVICASDSSWLQNRMSSISQSLCHIVPGLAGTTWPRINPFSLLGCAAGTILILALFFVDIYDYHSADSIAGIFISSLFCITMYPMSAYSGKLLLQGTPSHITDLLDKCLREASTLDGVLEFRNEHFWLLGFDKIVGTVHVRIRRDANEQMVLSHLLNKLSSLVTDLTIQVTKSVFKDEWAWSSSTRQILNDSFMKFPPVTEAYSSAITIPSVISSSVKNITVSSCMPLKNSFPSTYSSSNMKTYEPKVSPSTYSTVPLPPSLSGSQDSRYSKLPHHSIDMTPGTNVPKHPPYDVSQQTPSHVYQTMYKPESATSISKYNRELNINPLFTTSPDYVKSYMS